MKKCQTLIFFFILSCGSKDLKNTRSEYNPQTSIQKKRIINDSDAISIKSNDEIDLNKSASGNAQESNDGDQIDINNSEAVHPPSEAYNPSNGDQIDNTKNEIKFGNNLNSDSHTNTPEVILNADQPLLADPIVENQIDLVDKLQNDPDNLN